MPWLYSSPEKLDYKQVDEPIRKLVKMINKDTVWLRTEESCCGHPIGDSSWGGSELYIRLVAIEHPERLFTLIDLLRESTGGMNWHVKLEYDRTDELGTHWFMNIDYRKLDNRDILIDTLRRIVDTSIVKEGL